MRSSCVLGLALFCASHVIAAPAGEDEAAWERYRQVFRAPNDIRYEITFKRPRPAGLDESQTLQNAAGELRSHPQIEEAFPLDGCTAVEMDEAVIFLTLNSSPLEFGAWIERLRPHLVRRAFHNYAARKDRPTDEQLRCLRPDPLCLFGLKGSAAHNPLFKQPLPTGIFIRLRTPAGGASPEYFEQQGARFEELIRSIYDRAGYPEVQVSRDHYLPASGPNPASVALAAGLTAAVLGTALFAFFFRSYGAWLGALFAVALSFGILWRAAAAWPGWLDSSILPAAAAIGLFWSLRAFELRQGARAMLSRRALLSLGIGGAAALALRAVQIQSRELSLFYDALPLFAAAALGLMIFGWAAPRSGEENEGRAEAFLIKTLCVWRNFLVCMAVAALCVFIGVKAYGRVSPKVPLRDQRPGAWDLSPDNQVSPDTFCMLTEANAPEDLIYQLAAQRYACEAAHRDKLLTRYWDPSSWIPKPGWQQANAADFLRKRNAVVIEKIAAQEGLRPREIAPTIEFLNRFGQMALPLTTGEVPQWDVSSQPDSLGFRVRQWLHIQAALSGDSKGMVALSYARPTSATSLETVLPWIAAATKPFKVEPRWVVPQYVRQNAIRSALIQIAVTGLACLALVVAAAAMEKRSGFRRATVATFLFLGSWFLTCVAIGPAWSRELAWIWTAVAAWHAALTLEWMPLKSASRHRPPLASSLIAAAVLLVAYGWWSYPGRVEVPARLVGVGVLWSFAWTALLLAPKREMLTSDPA